MFTAEHMGVELAVDAGQSFLNALLNCFDCESAGYRCPAASPKCFKNDICIRKHSDFLHMDLTSQLEWSGEVVLSKQLGQPAKSKSHGLGRFARRQSSIFQCLVEHLHKVE